MLDGVRELTLRNGETVRGRAYVKHLTNGQLSQPSPDTGTNPAKDAATIENLAAKDAEDMIMRMIMRTVTQREDAHAN